MKQILHIFRKDVRHLWPEILCTLAVTAAYVPLYQNLLTPDVVPGMSLDASNRLHQMQVLARVMVGLVPACWWLLITRVVHAETMVGDRQYWLTRPYEWKKLLAAKALFVAVFVYLPLTTALCVLLAQAGFQPLHFMLWLLLGLLAMTEFFIAPVFLIATVTRNFGYSLLTILMLLLGIGGILYADDLLDPAAGFFALPGNTVEIAIILCFCCAAIAQQYAARRVWLSRTLLVLLPLMMLFFEGFVMQSSFMVQLAYGGRSGVAHPVVIAQGIGGKKQIRTMAGSPEKLLTVHIPIAAGSVTSDRAVFLDAVKAEIKPAQGRNWESNWQTLTVRFLPGEWISTVSFQIMREDYERLKSEPVTMHLTFALDVLKAGRKTVVASPVAKFEVPGFGSCSPLGWDKNEVDSMYCLLPLHQPQETLVQWAISGTKCDLPQPDVSKMGVASEWQGELDPYAVGWTSVLDNSIYTNQRNGSTQVYCKGLPISFTPYTRVGRTMEELTLTNVELPAEGAGNTNE